MPLLFKGIAVMIVPVSYSLAQLALCFLQIWQMRHGNRMVQPVAGVKTEQTTEQATSI